MTREGLWGARGGVQPLGAAEMLTLVRGRGGQGKGQGADTGAEVRARGP